MLVLKSAPVSPGASEPARSVCDSANLATSSPGGTGSEGEEALMLMHANALRAGLLVQLLVVLFALTTAGAPAQSGRGPRETVDQRFTTTRPSSPTGLGFSATYH